MQFSFGGHAYLLKLAHQTGCEDQAILVRVVQIFRKDLINHIEIT